MAKHVFQLHGVDQRGHVVLIKRLSRAKVLPYVAQLPPCLIGLLGHTVKLMSPQFVRPYVQRQQNDANDAAGICEAVSRPQMRCVPIKSVEQQDLQALHCRGGCGPGHIPHVWHESVQVYRDRQK